MDPKTKEVIILLVCCLVSIKSKVYSQIDGLDKYGFIIGNQCGQVIESEFSNDHLSIHIAFPEKKTLCGKLEGNLLTGAYEGQSFTMIFDADGTGVGKLNNGTELFMVRGEKNSHTNYEKLLESRGLKNSFHRFMTDQGIALEAALGIYTVVYPNGLSVTLIFGEKHIGSSSQFKRTRVNTITYSKGKWGSV